VIFFVTFFGILKLFLWLATKSKDKPRVETMMETICFQSLILFVGYQLSNNSGGNVALAFQSQVLYPSSRGRTAHSHYLPMPRMQPLRPSQNTHWLAAVWPFKTPPPPSPPPNPIQTQIKELAKHSTLAGHLRAILKKLELTPAKTKVILGSISSLVNWEELVFFFFMGWFFVPLIEIPNNYIRKRFEKALRPFRRSYTKLVADQIAQASQLAFLVYIVDIAKIILQGLGFRWFQTGDIPHIFGKSIFAWWIANRVSALKRYALAKQTRNDPSDLYGQVQLVDHILDAFIYGIGAFALLDNLEADLALLKSPLQHSEV
jgi:hypothetical protein